jgi:hypothetical protein
MRRAATDADLDKIPVSEADVEEFAAGCGALMDRLFKLGIPDGAVTGVALIRAACTRALLLRLPREDLERFVLHAAAGLRPPEGAPPQLAEIPSADQLHDLCARISIIAGVLFRREHPANTVGYMLHNGVGQLRFLGYPIDKVEAVFAASWKDAEEFMKAVTKQKGAKA